MKTLKFETENEIVKAHSHIEDVLIYDIETDSLDTNMARCVFFGAYSYKYKKYFIFHEDEHEEIQNLIDEHKVLVGFNNKSFDGPILENITNQFDITYKIVFDCMMVLYDYKRKRSNREGIIKFKGKTLQESLPNRKLKTVCETLEFPVTKGDIDYAIFQKSSWTEEELKEIYKYLFKDVELTRMLFEFYVEYFEPFKEYVNKDSIRKFDYIRSSLGSYAYSALCNLADIEPEFEDDYFELQKKPLNAGGFVLEPQVPYAEGTVIYADFSSLYPNLMIQCNLFSTNCKCCIDEKKWNGDNFFELQGKYCNKKLGKIETVLKDIYMKRREYKKNKDPREIALKIMINTIYGLSGSPIFKNVFNMTTSGDTTAIGRKCINYTRERFKEEGIETVYGDTDSVFLVLPKEKNIEDYKILAEKIVEELQTHMPFAH